MITDITLFFVGILVGGMNAIAGGGTIIGYPAMVAAGLPPLVANVTGSLVVLPGLISSVYGYRKYLTKLPRRYLILLVPCVIGGIVGSLILRHTSSTQFEKLVPGLIVFAVILFAVQPLLHFHLHRHISSKSKKIQTLLLIGLALLPTAAYAGYFGAGFGFIMLAFLGFTSINDVHKMNALKNIAGAVIAVVTIICLLNTHLFNWHIGLIMATGNAIGGYSGARLSLRLSSHIIRILVIVFGFMAAIYLGLRAY
ncbi:MAG: sulfite exporter TauE/SafE family protein [Candidatus Saccharimonadales bacterium]